MFDRIGKRLIDLAGAAIGLIVSAPVFVLIAIAIKVTSKGPVLYRGTRVGLNKRLFRMFKFRTMVANADRIGGPSTPENDARVTSVGRFLRRHKLDELPQLINVLLGDMSLVGPRPEVPEYVALLQESEWRILSVRPGITDYASLRFRNEGDILKGAADPEEAYLRLIRPEKTRLGLEYVDTRNLWIDLKILATTFLRLAFG